MAESSKDIVVLGLDPGSLCTGYGVVAERSGTANLVAVGTIRTKKTDDLGAKLGLIFDRVQSIAREHRPDEAVLENVFTAKNAASALKLGQARGAALAAVGSLGIPVFSYEPTVIKRDVTGHGRADKSQVAFMVGRILGRKPDWAKDASDALAAAICRLNRRRFERLAGV